MRIASYYGDIRTVGRNDGGPLYHTYCLRKLFGRENVKHILPKGDITRKGKFDLHYWVDWGEDAMGYTDFVCPKPNVYVASDTHLGFDYRVKKAKEFDWVFCNQNKAVGEFIDAGIPKGRCHWLPHGFDPLAYSPGIFNKGVWLTDAVPQKKYDVCFVGNLNDEDRVRHLDRLFKEFPNFTWNTKRFHEAAEVYNQSRIVFNVTCRGEQNMRFFEAMGCKSFLLSDNITESENLFKPGVHYGGYEHGNFDDMIKQAHYWLKHEKEREAIAEAGYKEVINNHTYMHRVTAVLDLLGVSYDRSKAGINLVEA